MPILLTYDIHTHAAHSAPEVDRYLHHVLELHARIGVRASFFFPAEAARAMKQTVVSLVREGHAVGCHGLTHRSESYKAMPLADQRENLSRATREIEDIIQQRVTFFRAPVFKISGATIRVLEELGYEADLSMNSQRLGLLSSDVWNVSWMVAPRRPYHPDCDHPWLKGQAKLWEIPLSCTLLPYMSSTALVCGLGFMKAFFWSLRVESRFVRKPIVYMAHPEEFCSWREGRPRQPFRWRDMVPTPAEGLRFRRALLEVDPKKIAETSEALLEHMCGDGHVRLLTVPEYVAQLNG